VLTDAAVHPVSPCTLAYAIRKMIREQIFPPAPAELRSACGQIAQKLYAMSRSPLENE
jgi:hypothetical protein